MSWMKKYKKKFNLFKVVLGRDNPTIIEIGAHFGEDSVRFTEAFPSARIFAFEPDPRSIEIFKKHVNDDRIELIELALSDVEGELEFFQSYQEYQPADVPSKYDWISEQDYKKGKLNNSGSSSLKKGYQHVLGETIKVKSKRYDNWACERDIRHVDLAWIDVQGAEKDVILGMGDEIKNIKFIWTEYGEMMYEGSMSRQDTIKLLDEKGFGAIEELSDRGSSGDLLFRNRSL